MFETLSKCISNRLKKIYDIKIRIQHIRSPMAKKIVASELLTNLLRTTKLVYYYPIYVA